MNHSDEIKARLDVVDLIGEYINLKAVGSNFRAICPFHNEKTPSLMISPDKQIWHCFGCGKGGDIISFVMEMEGLDFIEALKLLAPRAGVVIDNKNFSNDSKKNRLLEILELSKKYYNFILNSEKTSESMKRIKAYLLERGLDDQAVDRWKIGYSLDSHDDLINFLKSKKFTDAEIFSAGISFKSERGNYLNRFRDRIMFPINDASGRTVAFTARINPFSSNDKNFGKYINSPQTEIYDKSKILFALDKAKLSIKEKGEIILVEGQMDAISAHEAGFTNVCAVSGTALTEYHLSIIKRYTKTIVMAFDGDLAGENATDRGISEALKTGFSLKIVSLPKGSDPDEIIKKNKDDFADFLKLAQNIMNYYLEKEFSSINIENINEKNKAVHKILTVINMLYNKVEQDFWLKELSQKSKTEEVFLREELHKISTNINKNNKKDNNKVLSNYFKQDNNSTWEDKLMENLLSLILKNNQYCEYIFNNLDPIFISGKYKEFYNYFLIYYNKNKDFSYNSFELAVKNENNDILLACFKKISLISEFYLDEDLSLDEKIKEDLIKNIVEIKRNYFKELIKSKKDALIIAERDNLSDEIFKIMEDLKNFNEELRKIM